MVIYRITKNPDVRYSSQSGEPLAVARYTLAVNRQFKRQGEADADFNCVSFGKGVNLQKDILKKVRRLVLLAGFKFVHG